MPDGQQQPTYFVRSMGKITGPFDIERLKRLRARGQFGPASDLSTDRRNWQPWSSLECFATRTAKVTGANTSLQPEATVTTATSQVEHTPPPAATLNWYYANDTGTSGPVSRSELLLLITDGTLTPTSLVWQDGMQEWQTVADIPELQRSLGDKSNKVVPSGTTTSRRLRFSNFWRRVAAQLFDNLILQVIGFGLLFLVLLYVAPSGVSEQQIYIVAAVSQFLLHWLYYASLESSQLQATFGKLAMELKVTNVVGNRIGFGQASSRYFGKLLSGLIFGIGFLMVGFTEKRQGLHDILADCLVLDQES